MHNFDQFNNDKINVTMNRGVAIMKMMQSFSPEKINQINELRQSLIQIGQLLTRESSNLGDINAAMLQEVRMASKTNPFKPIEEQEHELEQFKGVISGKHFIRIAYEIAYTYSESYFNLIRLCQNAIPDEIHTTEGSALNVFKGTGNLKDRVYEWQFNEASIMKFTQTMISIDRADRSFQEVVAGLGKTLEGYYNYLSDRHKNRGVKMHSDALITDIAYAIFENVDAHGEIKSDTNLEEISAYTLNKGLLVVESVKNPIISKLISGPDVLIKYVIDGIKTVQDNIDKITSIVAEDIDEIKSILGLNDFNNSDDVYQSIINKLRDINPGSIIGREDTFITQDERFSREFNEDTIGKIVEMLRAQANPKEILTFIMERKRGLKEHFQNENTFYVCQIGQGNPFLGTAPGALTVIPGKKPNVTMDDVLGDGFDDVRNFYKSIEASTKWQALFIATSPSKSADKSNALLIGPAGTGKTEILRAIGADKNCIAIFAQGSDFLTCWKGEAEKNPKRLFEHALRLHKETKKRVFILIDEIDSVMHHPAGHNDINLTLEFQILMDGLVAYPGISIWGATNFPEKIPTAMLRRFSFTKIVGELDTDDTVKLLQNFLAHIPQKDFTNTDWQNAAEKLHGATGDIVRKVCDHIWRKTITNFVSNNENEANEVLNTLTAEEKDFDISKFNDEARTKFKNVLSQHVNILPNDLNESIDWHLQNLTIKHEIENAMRTYDMAKKLLGSTLN